MTLIVASNKHTPKENRPETIRWKRMRVCFSSGFIPPLEDSAFNVLIVQEMQDWHRCCKGIGDKVTHCSTEMKDNDDVPEK
jgi:hypothetical protein